MRTKTFNVPTDSMVEFAEVIEENQLQGIIAGVTEDEEIIVNVEYERDQRDTILDLMELLEIDEDEE